MDFAKMHLLEILKKKKKVCEEIQFSKIFKFCISAQTRISIFWFQHLLDFPDSVFMHITKVQNYDSHFEEKWSIALWESRELSSKVYKLILFIRGTEGENVKIK